MSSIVPNVSTQQSSIQEFRQTLKTNPPFKDLSQTLKPNVAVSVPAVNKTDEMLEKLSGTTPKQKSGRFEGNNPLRRSMSATTRVSGVPIAVSNALSLRQMSTKKDAVSEDWHEIGNLVNGEPSKVTVADIRKLARDPEKLNSLFDKASKRSKSEDAVYNSPSNFSSDGHAYLVYKRIPITPEQFEKLSNAGPLNQHIVAAFPNGSEVQKGGTDRAERVRLGVAAEVIISEKGSHQVGDGKRIDKHLATTSSKHPLDGDAIHAARLEKDAVTFLYVGAGRSNVPTVDRQNNLLSGKLWCTTSEVALARALDPKNYQDSLSESTRKNLKDLESSDKQLSQLGIYARRAFGQNTTATVDSMTVESSDASKHRASQAKGSGEITPTSRRQELMAQNELKKSQEGEKELVSQSKSFEKNEHSNGTKRK